MRSHLLLLAIIAAAAAAGATGVTSAAGVTAAAHASQYSIVDIYEGQTFFDNFNFYTDNDPTHGYVDYVSQQEAQLKGLISHIQDKVYIGPDFMSVVAPGERGRKSVRLESKKAYRGKMVIIDLEHMPAGCGTWPAFWMCGANWPTNGEVDIIENVNVADENLSTLHTKDGCDMKNEDYSKFTGKWGLNMKGGDATNCYVNAPDQYANQGCSITADKGTFGQTFNEGMGGVYVTNWDVNNFISVYYFPRNSIPEDIKEQRPDPSSWGRPYAYFQLGADCSPDHFLDQSIIINLTFCGDWGGSVFPQQCPGKGACQDFVQNHPDEFQEAYWLINSIIIYESLG